MDILFDKIPETAVNNELYGMKLLTQKARRLWKSWSKDMPAAGFFEKYDALVEYDNRLNDLDFIVDTYVLNILADSENNFKIYNPILEFVMIAREVGLKTNRMTS
tara:strand:- start:1006 stop:1320 length:315 start_codon:yes stop_codon:yes gene_type:complete